MNNILHTINKEYDNFSKMHKKLADYVLANSDSTILMSISQLSKESGVSEATIVRFTYRLGFEGYKDFQRALLNSIKYSITTVERLQSAQNLDHLELVKKQINNDLNDINKTFIDLDPEIIVNAAYMIDKARRVYIIGLRTSNILAQYLYHYLTMMDFTVINIESTQMEPFEQLIGMTEDDILITFSFPRYSQKTIESTRLISEKGYDIISITDSENSPVTSLSTINLIANMTMASIFDSLVSPLAIINSLIIAISHVTQKNIKNSLKQLEEYWEEANTYEKI